MADNSVFDPGTGGDTYRSKDRAGVKTEIVGIDLGIGSGSESLMTGSMPINDNSGSITVDNAGTFAVQAALTSTTNAGATAKTSDYDTGAGTDTVTSFGIALPASGGAVQGGTSTNPVRTDPTGTTTQPVSGTVTANAGTGTMAVSAASLPLPSGAATSAKQPALGTAGSASSDVLSVQGVASMTALKVDGSGVTQPVSGTVTANAGSGPFPVSDNSGSLTVDAPVGTPVFVTATPSTTGGWSKSTALAQTTTKKAVKASAGTFGGYYAYNPNASVAYIQVFDVASGSVTLGTTAPDLVFGIPAGSAANLEIANGVNMGTAITLACTTTASGSTAPSTGLDLTILFK